MRDLIPLYAVYVVLFADAGLSTTEITSLLVIWSVTAFAFEVPSGAWADTVSRRGLLVLSSVLYAGCFAAWTLLPSYPAFAVGFVLWGVSSSLMSGTFEALLYDELAVLAATDRYAGLIGRAEALATGCNLFATLAAAPLMALGGYRLVGVVSICVALAQGGLALGLPAAPRVASAAQDPEGLIEEPAAPGVPAPHAEAEAEGFWRRYVHMLTAGLGEVRGVPVVRRAVLLSALLYGLTAFDEYFGLLALEHGADLTSVPLLVGLTVAGQAIGTATAGRTASWPGGVLGALVAASAMLVAVGCLLRQPWAAFAALGAGYGLLSNVSVVAEARLQDAIEGPARATVTSTVSLGSEVVALGVFGVFAAAPVVGSIAMTMAGLSVLVLVIGALVPRWMPALVVPDETPDTLCKR